VVDLAASLNADCHSAMVNHAALEQALRKQGAGFVSHLKEHCPHLFATVPFFVSAAQMVQMKAVIAAVERVVSLPAWREKQDVFPVPISSVPDSAESLIAHDLSRCAKGVFYGYDFHLNAAGAHLIEINTNAGGAFLNELLLQSQRGSQLPGGAAAPENLEQLIVEMFRNEWRLERGAEPLKTLVIVDEDPLHQYLYPEFILAQRMFERAGIMTLIADPAELEVRADGLYCRECKIDLVYNRLTDFYLQKYPVLSSVLQNKEWAVITPHPQDYNLYADKYNLVVLTDADRLRGLGVVDADIAVLQAGIPQARKVLAEDAEEWWQQRKQWFFKPASGFGSKGAYRGAKLTQSVFASIVQGGYVAQRLALPGERAVCGEGEEAVSLKSDVRCYVYDGQVQLVAARLYQGQTTNFRTVNGGFSPVRIVG
jgi:hypothetical protein